MKIIKVLTIADCINTTASLIKKLRQNNEKCIVFSEDKITLNLEIETAKRLGGGFLDVDVTTFKRYVSSVVPTSNVLSKESSVMMVRKIIAEQKNNLQCFEASINKPNLSLILYELISQLESANVTPQILKELIESDNCGAEGAFLLKIKDIALIYEKYVEALCKANLKDGNNYFSLMPNLVKRDESIKNSTVILCGFSTITSQRQDVISALIQNAKEVYSIILDSNDSDVYTGETCKKLMQICKDSQIYEVKPSSKEIEALKKYLYNVEVFKKGFNAVSTSSVTVSEYSTPIKEVENVVKSIKNHVINENGRYKDCVVSVGSILAYKPIIERVFKEQNVPYYVDSPVTLSEHPISNYVISYLNFFKRGLLVKDFLNFVSSGLFCLDRNLLDKLYVYVSKHAFSRKLLKNEVDKTYENASELEALRKTAIEVASYLINAKTADEIVEAIKKMLSATNCFNNMKELGKKLTLLGEVKYADFNDKAEEKLNDFLQQIVFVLKGEKVSISEFINVFTSGVTATNVGSIPLFNDAVYVGEIKDVKIKNAGVLYALGLNGDVPFVKSDTALLSDGDLAKLDGFKIIVEPKIKIVNKREKESVAVALMSFTNYLHASYVSQNLSGEEAQKSDIINYLTAIFNLKINKFLDYETLPTKYEGSKKTSYDYLEKSTALKKIAKLSKHYKEGNAIARYEIASFYNALSSGELSEVKESASKLLLNNDTQKVLKKGSDLCFKNGHISATTLEKYFSCPYANYSQNVLKLKEEKTEDLKVTELGTLLHDLTENYVKKIDSVNSKQQSDELVSSICKNIFENEKYVDYGDNPQHKFLFNRLEKEGKRVCFAIYNSIKNSLFKPYYIEASFNDNSEFKAINLNAKTGKYKISGKVDRIDIYQDKIRVIDYKTGGILHNDEYFYTGNKLQLYLYMNAFLKGGLKPAGAYYFPVHDSFSLSGESNYKMRGKTVESKDILEATDVDLYQNGDSEFVSIKLKKDGNVYSSSETLNQSDMDAYLKYAVKISEKGVDEINSGFIAPSPYKDACTYCSYGGMCGISPNENCVRKEKKIDASTIINAVNNEEEI